jgi:predicted AAA+ superfamily ATPase
MGLYQACLSMRDEKTRAREISSLTAAMEELHLETGSIITVNEEELIESEQGTIQVQPAYKFFLENQF